MYAGEYADVSDTASCDGSAVVEYYLLDVAVCDYA